MVSSHGHRVDTLYHMLGIPEATDGQKMPASTRLNQPISAPGALLPQEVALAGTNWLNRARHYAVFSPAWYRYRSIAVLGVVTAVCLLAVCLWIEAMSPAQAAFQIGGWAGVGRIAMLVLVPLYLLCLFGPGLAVAVRQRSLAPRLEAPAIVFVILGSIGGAAALGAALAAHYEKPWFDSQTGILTTSTLPFLKFNFNYEVSVGGRTMTIGPDIDKKYRPDYIPPAPAPMEKSIDGKVGEIENMIREVNRIRSETNGPTKITFPGKTTTIVSRIDYGPAIGAGLIVCMICWIGGVFDLFAYFFQRNRIVEVLQREEVKRAQIARNVAELRLTVLAAQIEPHFLFNTLASVRSAITTDPQRATHIVDHMVSFLRSTIPQMREDAISKTVDLSSQMESVRSYLALMHERIPRLQFSVSTEAGLDSAQLPPLMLISLVENAVKHGVEPKVGPARVDVTARRRGFGEGAQLELVVCDDGAGFGDAVSGDGIGIANIQERLRTLFGQSADLSLKALPGGGVAAILRLPLSFDS